MLGKKSAARDPDRYSCNGDYQSSSASVGILQTLAMNGIVNWKSAVFITLGQNIGT